LGDDKAAIDEPDPMVTTIGVATNLLAGVFWGSILALRLRANPSRSGADILCEAALVAGFAGILDYGILPRRLSPGWEFGLAGSSVAIAFGAMGLGLAGGALASDVSVNREGARRPTL
jgi:hypothetical protein